MAKKLADMNVVELRKLAKDKGVKDIAGKGAADLRRMIEKAEKGAAGKGTAADKKAKPTAKATKAAKGAKASAAADEDTGGGVSRADFIKLVLLVKEVAEFSGCEIEIPEDWEDGGKKPKKGAKGKASPPDEEDEEDDDATDEDEDEDEEDEEDEDEDDEDDPTAEPSLDIDPESLEEMGLAELKTTCRKIHSDKDIMEASGGKKIDTDTKSSSELRKRIIAFLNKYATEEEVEDEDEEDEESGVPDWATEGLAVEVNVGDDEDEDWQRGKIVSMTDEECSVRLDDGSGAEGPWDSIRQAPKKPKKR